MHLGRTLKNPLHRLRWIVGATAVSTLTAIWGATIFTLHTDRQNLEASVIKDSSNFTRLFLEHMEQVVGAVESALKRLDRQIQLDAKKSLNPENLFKHLSATGPGLQGVMFGFVLSPEGKLLSVSDPRLKTAVDLNFRSIDELHGMQHKSLLQIAPINTSLGREFHFLPITRSVVDEQGKLLAIVGMALKPDEFNRLFAELTKEGGIRADVRLLSGVSILSSASSDAPVVAMAPEDIHESSGLRAGESGHWIKPQRVSGAPTLIFSRRSEEFPYSIIVVRDFQKMEESFWKSAVVQLWLTFLISLGVGFLCWLTLRKIDQVEGNQQEIQRLIDLAGRSSRMEAIGRLAEGIAKDFGQILGAMFTSVESLEEKSRDIAPGRDALEKMKKSLHRARDLLGQVTALRRLNAAGGVDAFAPTGMANAMPGIHAEKCILFVESDEAVASLVRDYFAGSAIAAMVFTDSGQALEEIRRDVGRFRLLIVAESAQPIGGRELFAEARRQCPEIPSVLVLEGESFLQVRRMKDHVILPKPYGFSEMMLAIRMAEGVHV